MRRRVRELSAADSHEQEVRVRLHQKRDRVEQGFHVLPSLLAAHVEQDGALPPRPSASRLAVRSRGANDGPTAWWTTQVRYSG